MLTILRIGAPLEQEYKRAREWVEKKLDFERDAKFNMFEVRSEHFSHYLVFSGDPYRRPSVFSAVF